MSAGARERLLFIVAGKDAEDARDAAVERDSLDAGGGLRRDVQVVVRLMAYDGAQADDCVEAASFGQALDGDGKLERAGHPVDVVLADSMPSHRVERAVEEPRGDRLIEARDH